MWRVVHANVCACVSVVGIHAHMYMCLCTCGRACTCQCVCMIVYVGDVHALGACLCILWGVYMLISVHACVCVCEEGVHACVSMIVYVFVDVYIPMFMHVCLLWGYTCQCMLEVYVPCVHACVCDEGCTYPCMRMLVYVCEGVYIPMCVCACVCAGMGEVAQRMTLWS